MAMGPALLPNNSLIQPLTHTVVADGEQRLRRHTLADVAHAGVQVADMPEKGAKVTVYNSGSVNMMKHVPLEGLPLDKVLPDVLLHLLLCFAAISVRGN